MKKNERSSLQIRCRDLYNFVTWLGHNNTD